MYPLREESKEETRPVLVVVENRSPKVQIMFRQNSSTSLAGEKAASQIYGSPYNRRFRGRCNTP